MNENIVKKTNNYGLSLIPENSGGITFRRFRTLLMGDGESNMQKIDAALSVKGAKLSVNDNGGLELRDEHGMLLCEIPAEKLGTGGVKSVNGQTGTVVLPEGFAGIRVYNENATEPSEQWIEAAASDMGGELNIYPGDNIRIEVDNSGLTVSAEVNKAELVSAVLEAIPNGNGVKY